MTLSGKRINTAAVSVLDNRPLGKNVRSHFIAKDGTDTVIKLNTAQKIPFSISYDNQSYDSGDNGNYYVSSFTASSITITFDYVTSVSAGTLSFPESAVFTSGTWSTSNSGDLVKTRLTLNLRQQGIYSGVTTYYDNEDNLVFRFNGRRSDVSGATIVIDPGHGYTGKSAFDPGAVGHIKDRILTLRLQSLLSKLFR